MSKTAIYGIEHIQYIGRILWATLPEITKDSDTLTKIQTENKIKERKYLHLQTVQSFR